MKKAFAVIIAVLLVVGVALAQEVTFSGELSSLWGVTAPGTKNPGDFTTGMLSFTPALEVYSGDGTIYVEGTISEDTLTDELSFVAGEAYVDYTTDFWGIRLGRQNIVWGQADGINITNQVFPENSGNLLSDDSGIPVTAARLSLTGAICTVDGYVLPFFKGSVYPLAVAAPEKKLENMEYGLKASGYFPFCDVSLYGFYGWDKTPVLSYDMAPEPTISVEYKRLSMVGIDAAKPIGETVLRLEAAYFPNRYLQASDVAIMNGKNSTVQQNQVGILAGIDWMPDGWTVTAQYYCDVLLNKSADLKRTNAYEQSATLSITKSLLNDSLEVSAGGMVNVQDLGSVHTVSVVYSLTDEIHLSCGSVIFLPGPDKDGTYGQLKDYSTIYIKSSFMY